MQWSGKSRGGSCGYGFFIFILDHFGRGIAYAFLWLVVPYFVLFAPKNSYASWLYWRHIIGRSRVQAACSVFLHYYRFGQIIIDKMALFSSAGKDFEFDFKNYDHFLEVLNSGKGVVLIGAHYGNWQVGAKFFGEYARKLNLLMFDAEYEKIKKQMERTMGDMQYNIIPVNSDGLSHVFLIKDALDKGEYVCLQGDRYMDSENTIETTFMGRKALFPAGPFHLASRLKVPMVFYFSDKSDKNKYTFHFFEAQEVKRSKETKLEELLLSQYVSVLEARLREYPEQWFNFYDFWNIKNTKL